MWWYFFINKASVNKVQSNNIKIKGGLIWITLEVRPILGGPRRAEGPPCQYIAGLATQLEVGHEIDAEWTTSVFWPNNGGQSRQFFAPKTSCTFTNIVSMRGVEITPRPPQGADLEIWVEIFIWNARSPSIEMQA